MKITISAPRGPQKAQKMTRILYVSVPGARKVLKSLKTSIFMTIDEKGEIQSFSLKYWFCEKSWESIQFSIFTDFRFLVGISKLHMLFLVLPQHSASGRKIYAFQWSPISVHSSLVWPFATLYLRPLFPFHWSFIGQPASSFWLD